MKAPTRLAYITAARTVYEEYPNVGTIDVPLHAAVRTDDLEADSPGAWVEAWVWVPDSVALAHDPLAAVDVPDFVRRAVARRTARQAVA